VRDVVALVAGTLLAVGALAFVIAPLFTGARPRRRSPAARRPVADDGAIRALREIEFDKATGKLSDADYAELKREYGAIAVQQMREAPVPAAAPVAAAAADPIESRVNAMRAAHRECPSCGLRPEPDAVYCSTCGAYLDGRCPDCGRSVTESAAGFCAACGAELAQPS